MSEKRFVACDKWADSEGNIFKFVVIDTKKLGDKQFILRVNHWSQAQDMCNKLNDTLDELEKENKQLKEKRGCESCIHRSYPTGQRYEYFENKDIYIRDNLTGERFYMSDLDMLCNLLNNYDKDWQRRRVERGLEIQKECFKIKDIPIEKKMCGYCKHFQLDGMFGFWCDRTHNWRLVNENCSDFER